MFLCSQAEFMQEIQNANYTCQKMKYETMHEHDIIEKGIVFHKKFFMKYSIHLENVRILSVIRYIKQKTRHKYNYCSVSSNINLTAYLTVYKHQTSFILCFNESSFHTVAHG
jgi:hypothetical protein